MIYVKTAQAIYEADRRKNGKKPLSLDEKIFRIN